MKFGPNESKGVVSYRVLGLLLINHWGLINQQKFSFLAINIHKNRFFEVALLSRPTSSVLFLLVTKKNKLCKNRHWERHVFRLLIVSIVTNILLSSRHYIAQFQFSSFSHKPVTRSRKMTKLFFRTTHTTKTITKLSFT